MRRVYLGDSYDAVKRLWGQVLAEWAPLYAAPQFIREDPEDPAVFHREFTILTGIPMLAPVYPACFSILNDPDTGIRLPDVAIQTENQKHIALTTICAQFLWPEWPGLRAVITYDQSDYRQLGKKQEQRRTKMNFLLKAGLSSFYYVSHAPFLFVFRDQGSRDECKTLLLKAGIPQVRFELDE